MDKVKTVRLLRVLRIVAVAVFIAAVFSYLDLGTTALSGVEQATYGLRLEVAGLLRSHLNEKARQNIAVVAISDDSYLWAAHGGCVPRYLPRKTYARLINVLTKYGAKVIAFDIDFDTPAPGDSELATAVKQSGRVVIACYQVDQYGRTSFRYPLSLFRKAGCRSGVAVVFAVDGPGEDDVEPVMEDHGNLVPQLSVEAVRIYSGRDSVPLGKSAQYPIPGYQIPLDPSDPWPAFKIRYLFDRTDVFPTVPIEDVVTGAGENSGFYSNFFSGKIVLVGSTAQIDHDFAATPLGQMPGVVINANAIATLLSRQFIRKASSGSELLFLWVFVAITTVLSSAWSLRRFAALILLILPSYFLLNVVVFVEFNYYAHLVATTVAILLTAFCILLDRGLTEEVEKSNMRELLQRYVNPQIADHILKHPELIGAGGKREVGTVLFSDIRGFTQLADVLSAEELVARMNEYFQVMTEVVFRHDGTAISFVGDAMLAVFGIPISVSDHADRAVAAAIEMQAANASLEEKWHAKENRTVSSGIGINTGEMIFGEIGGKHLRNFTVYGLEVNIAYRIEEMNQDLGTNILISEATYLALVQRVAVAGPHMIKVKGVIQPLKVYDVPAKQ